jgi:hypothetical protein
MNSFKTETQHPLTNQWNWSLIGGVIATAFTVIGLVIVGQVYSHLELQQLIEAMTPAMQMLGFTTVTATGTIIALMMTMLGLIHQADVKFKSSFYHSIRRIALFSTIDFIASVLLLSLVGIPFGEADTVPAWWLNLLYYALILANALISGMLVTIILMLYEVVKSMINALKPA